MDQSHNEIDYITHRPDSILSSLWEYNRASKQGHNYLPLYHRHFNEIRMQVKRVLEIGVQTDSSIRMWKDYFPNAEIYGLDIEPNCKQFEEDRIKIVIGDQSDRNVLSTLPDDFDIIIDDGSHIPEHQVGSFLYLFQHKMNSRGIYVVEDCECRPATVDFFARMTPLVNFWPNGFEGSRWPELNSFDEYTDNYFALNLLGVTFYRYIVFIDKGRNPGDGEAAHRMRKGIPNKKLTLEPIQ